MLAAQVKKEREQAKARQVPHPLTRRRYQVARERLGLTVNSGGMLDWLRLDKRTTFIWKHESFLETARWVISSSQRDFVRHPTSERSAIVMHYIQKGFGIARADILDNQRNAVLVAARAIAFVILKQSGLSRNEVARRMRRDYTSVKHAEDKYSYLFEGLPDVVEDDTNAIGPAPVGEPDGSISS